MALPSFDGSRRAVRTELRQQQLQLHEGGVRRQTQATRADSQWKTATVLIDAIHWLPADTKVPSVLFGSRMEPCMCKQ